MKLSRFSTAFVCAVLLAVGLAGCKKKGRESGGSTQVGIASWYGHPFDGRQTASGEIYDMEKMTAAHRTLPLQTVVKIENLTNGKTTNVRINDRGPFVKDRIVDLSHAAAQVISMPGIANVKLSVISMPATRDLAEYAVQVGAFANKNDADALRQQLAAKYSDARLVYRDGDQTWRVLVGLEPRVENASALADTLYKQYGQAYVVMADPQ